MAGRRQSKISTACWVGDVPPSAFRWLLSMMMSNDSERRFALRMALRLPIVVSGRSEDGTAWSEPTETDDISTLGALFHLNQKVTRADQLYLRAHRPDGAAIEVTVRVVRTAPAIYGTARVGVRIVEPTENWLRLFVSWVADEQSAPPEMDQQ